MKPTASREPKLLDRLYFKDEIAWLESCAQLIQERRYEELDHQHLKEYLRAMAERDKREVRSRLIQLIMHILKWQYQLKNQTNNWKNSIFHQREELEDLLSSKTLKQHAEKGLADIYAKALKHAIRETELDPVIFPKECPFSLDYLLGEEFPS